MGTKRPLGISVLEAARQRVAWTFDRFESVYVAFSGGKDSTVMLHLVGAEARRRGRRFGLVFLDLEGQYKATITHVAKCFADYADCSDPYWIALPLHLRNAVSVYQPFWLAFDPEQKDAWIREPPPFAITDESVFPFFYRGMEFEDFVPAFGEWFDGDKDTACLVGIRTDESLNRWRSIASTTKGTVDGHGYTTRIRPTVANVYPIYDWRTEDLWTYHARNPELPYNDLYNLMHLAGLSIHQMRICQPYGDDQRRGLWLFHLIEPETWARVVARVAGANSGALYVGESGSVSGYRRVSKPDGLTWQEFARTLLGSMPPVTQEHFDNKVVLFSKWWEERGYPDGIPDEAPFELEAARRVPSWRRVCKSLLRNDFWCKGLGFTQHKAHAYEGYMDLMRRRKETEPYSKHALLNH